MELYAIVVALTLILALYIMWAADSTRQDEQIDYLKKIFAGSSDGCVDRDSELSAASVKQLKMIQTICPHEDPMIVTGDKVHYHSNRYQATVYSGSILECQCCGVVWEDDDLVNEIRLKESREETKRLNAEKRKLKKKAEDK